MKRFLIGFIGLVLLQGVLLAAPSISYTSYFNNTHTLTNSTVVGTNSANVMVATNGITAGASIFNATLTLRNGATAMRADIHGTYTDASNYRRGFLADSTAGVFTIGSEGLGTGATGNTIVFSVDGSTRLTLSSSSSFSGSVAATGSISGTDINAGSGSRIFWAGAASLWSPASGLILLSNGTQNDFNRLQFGGTTASFPAEARNATGFTDVLADNSAPTFRLSTRNVLAKTTNYTAVASTATSGVDTDVSKVFTNEGAAAGVTVTLPAAATGLTYTFVVQDTDGITVLAVGDDTIRVAGDVSGAAGNISNSTIGGVVTILALNATEWFATSTVGTWAVSAP